MHARRLWLLPVLFAALACGGEDSRPPQPRTAQDTPAAADVVPAAATGEPEASKRRERPLPAFSGFSLDGEKVSISSLLGRRLLLFFFNPEVRDAVAVAKAVTGIQDLRGKHNFEILGIGVGSGRSQLEDFVREQQLDFRVLDDSAGRITRLLRLQSPIALVGVDAEGFVAFGMAQFAPGEGLTRGTEELLRTSLRLPPISAETTPVLGTRPKAPDFSGTPLDGVAPFVLADRLGQPVVLIFFLHTCPHCHHALEFLRETLPTLPEDKRPALVGVEITGRTYAVRRELESRDLDYFPVLFDDDGSIRADYGVFAGVPEIVLIDAEGRIAARSGGWDDQRHAPLLRMRLAQLSGAPVPMLLSKSGYSGNEVCGVCHVSAYETWTLTTHSTAYATLVEHSAERNDECVSCHVVGHGEAGGYVDSKTTPDLENVGCESCHGRGGPHLSPGVHADGNYAEQCATCHDAKHSLGFDYASFLPRVSHAANAHLLSLPLEEKQKLLAERGRPRDNLLPTSAAYVGSEACQGCHASEYETWSKSRHAASLEPLAKAEAVGNAECLKCHTTAYDKPGGFPKGGAASAHGDLARVGCESCHGPGGDHVKEGTAKLGSIVSLGDKCDSCVILQICGACHDEANDPGFEFEVQEKIDRQRHGTIEAGTGKPKGKSAQRRLQQSDATLIAEALALLESGG